MGVGSSRQDVEADSFLQSLVSDAPLTLSHEQMHSHLASYQWIPATTQQREQQMEERISSLLKRFLLNNDRSGNFARLVAFFVEQAHRPKGVDDGEKALLNALQIIRFSAKIMIENMVEEQFIEKLSVPGDSVDDDGAALSKSTAGSGDEQQLVAALSALVHVIVERGPDPAANYLVLYEAISTLIVLFTPVLFKSSPGEVALTLKCFLEHSTLKSEAALLTCQLTKFAIERLALPDQFSTEGGSIILGLASGFWHMLGSSSSAPKTPEPIAPLGLRSQLLLLVLVSSYPSETNAYAKALFGLGNADDPLYSSGHVVSYARLWTMLCKSLEGGDEKSLLLLYFLLLGNTYFKVFAISKRNIEALVLPLLQLMYEAPQLQTHQLYLASIALLIMSEDEFYNKLLHESELVAPARLASWYRERQVPPMTLGSFVFLNLIRAISVNLSQMRDRYLHSNCLAALANMSSEMRQLHALPVERLGCLFEQLAKRYRKLAQQLRRQTPASESTSAAAAGPRSDSPSPEIVDLGVLEELLRMLLEILNGILEHQMAHNHNLIHTLLYKRAVFQQFRSNPSFADVVQNLENIIQYYLAEVERVGYELVGADEVLTLIRDAAKQFPYDRLKRFPRLHFKFVEEQNSCEFFSPYCWKLITLDAMHWPNHKILLFDALDDVTDDAVGESATTGALPLVAEAESSDNNNGAAATALPESPPVAV